MGGFLFARFNGHVVADRASGDGAEDSMMVRIVAGNAADHASPSGDGMQNLLNYALGLSASATSSNASLNTQVNADGRLALTFMRARGELTYTVEVSDDLVTWTGIAANPGAVGEFVTVTDSSATISAKRFIRLEVSR